MKEDMILNTGSSQASSHIRNSDWHDNVKDREKYITKENLKRDIKLICEMIYN